jgi:hypothetical protein
VGPGWIGAQRITAMTEPESGGNCVRELLKCTPFIAAALCSGACERDRMVPAELVAPYCVEKQYSTASVDCLGHVDDLFSVLLVVGNYRNWNEVLGSIQLVFDPDALDVACPIEQPLQPRQYEQQVTVERVDRQCWDEPTRQGVVAPRSFGGPISEIADTDSGSADLVYSKQ